MHLTQQHQLLTETVLLRDEHLKFTQKYNSYKSLTSCLGKSHAAVFFRFRRSFIFRLFSQAQLWLLHTGTRLPLVVVTEEADVNLIVLFLHDFGWPESKTFHFSPNQLMIRYLEIKCLLYYFKLLNTSIPLIMNYLVKYNSLLWRFLTPTFTELLFCLQEKHQKMKICITAGIWAFICQR